MRNQLKLALLCLFFVCGGCGSEAGGEPKIGGLDGTWRGSLDLVIDQCSIGIDPLPELHQVSIDGDTVTLVSADGRVLHAAATSTDGFEVQISNGESFPAIDRVTYTNIQNGHASATVSHIWSRPGGCETTWSGPMNRD
jgi:hypothetical protein